MVKRQNKRAPYVKFQNRGTKKLGTPRGKFTLIKYYYVTMPAANAAAPQDAAVLRIDASTPFTPLTVISGTWTENDANAEPFGISSLPWTGYNKLVVLGTKVTAVVKDAIDEQPGGDETLHEGVMRLSRTSAGTTIVGATTNSILRERAYSKGKAFQLAKSTVVGLMKNASITQGYSGKRQMNAEPVGNSQLLIVNTAGTANTCPNPTYISLSIHVTNEKKALETLKPFKVQVNITYNIAFVDPADSGNIPVPIAYNPLHWGSYFSHNTMSLAAMAARVALNPAYHRRRALPLPRQNRIR